MYRLATLAFIAALSSMSSAAFASTADEWDTKERGGGEHTGFYLRLNFLGLGRSTASTSYDGVDMKVSGLSNSGDLGIGGALTENLILHGDIFGPIISSPTITLSQGAASASADSDGSVNGLGLGLGLTYYFMPANVYLTLIVGRASMAVENEDGETVGETKGGFSGMLSLGKEWFVTENWGLGLVGSLVAQSMSDKGIDARWKTLGFNFGLSATYN